MVIHSHSTPTILPSTGNFLARSSGGLIIPFRFRLGSACDTPRLSLSVVCGRGISHKAWVDRLSFRRPDSNFFKPQRRVLFEENQLPRNRPDPSVCQSGCLECHGPLGFQPFCIEGPPLAVRRKRTRHCLSVIVCIERDLLQILPP